MKSIDINERSPWQDITEGNQIYEPATSRNFCTGEWRTSTPVMDWDKCKQCLLCAPVCPDSSIPVCDGKRQKRQPLAWYDHAVGYAARGRNFLKDKHIRINASVSAYR